MSFYEEEEDQTLDFMGSSGVVYDLKDGMRRKT